MSIYYNKYFHKSVKVNIPIVHSTELRSLCSKYFYDACNAQAQKPRLHKTFAHFASRYT